MLTARPISGMTILGDRSTPSHQGATIFGETPAPASNAVSSAFGATLFNGMEPAARSLADAVMGRTAPAPVVLPQRHWRGGCDRHWPHNSPELRLDAQGNEIAPLIGGLLQPNVSCNCGGQQHLEEMAASPGLLRHCTIEHAHTYRVTCPVCLWYANVAADQLYPIPVHSECSGAYTLVRSELYAYPVYKWNATQFDPNPAYWTIYNRWTGKYVADLQGTETPDQDLAHHFASELDATQFARQSQNTALAHALAQPPPEGEGAQCGECQQTYPMGTTECSSCLAHYAGTGFEPLVRANFERGRGWVHLFPHNAAGQGILGSMSL